MSGLGGSTARSLYIITSGPPYGKIPGGSKRHAVSRQEKPQTAKPWSLSCQRRRWMTLRQAQRSKRRRRPRSSRPRLDRRPRRAPRRSSPSARRCFWLRRHAEHQPRDHPLRIAAPWCCRLAGADLSRLAIPRTRPTPAFCRSDLPCTSPRSLRVRRRRRQRHRPRRLPRPRRRVRRRRSCLRPISSR